MDLDPTKWGGLELGLKICPVKTSNLCRGSKRKCLGPGGNVDFLQRQSAGTPPPPAPRTAPLSAAATISFLNNPSFRGALLAGREKLVHHICDDHLQGSSRYSWRAVSSDGFWLKDDDVTPLLRRGPFANDVRATTFIITPVFF